MGQLRDILRVGTVAVEEMTLLDQLPQLSSTSAIVIPRGKFDELVTDP